MRKWEKKVVNRLAPVTATETEAEAEAVTEAEAEAATAALDYLQQLIKTDNLIVATSSWLPASQPPDTADA